MSYALVVVGLVVTVLAGTALATRLRVPAPLLLTVVGVVISFIRFVDIEITDDLVLVGLLPPLLYAAAIRTSLIDFRANRRPIALLSVGLVVFTTLGVGVVAHALLPISWSASFAIGAVVAPPDAVAATAIARRVGMPRRIVTILEGESLINDATALVCLRTAVGAILAGSAVTGGSDEGHSAARGVTFDLPGLGAITLDFLFAAGVGVLVGVVVAVLFSKIRRRLTDTVSDTTLSLVAPWVAFLPAEAVHGSGFLAVVVAGLLMGHKAPVVQSAASRISERTYWRTIAHVLENSVFLLIGLQALPILEDVGDSELSTSTIVVACVGVLVAVVVLRPLWVFPATYLPRMLSRVIRENDPPPPWQYPAVISWAGMRGVVTLAAVFALPDATPHREVLVLVALVVTFATLMLQGATLPWLVRRLGVRGPDPLEDRLQEAAVLQDATAAGLRVLDQLAPPGSAPDPDGILAHLRLQAQRRTHLAWERLGQRAAQDESPSQRGNRLRLEMLRAEHEEVLRIRDGGTVAHEVLERVMALLDLEESVLVKAGEAADEMDAHDGDLLAPARPGGRCEHLQAAPAAMVPATPGVCPDCILMGITWVHLRMCLECGNVGCCDSSQGKHADQHFLLTGHPVMRSVEAGEAWRWCFRDAELG